MVDISRTELASKLVSSFLAPRGQLAKSAVKRSVFAGLECMSHRRRYKPIFWHGRNLLVRESCLTIMVQENGSTRPFAEKGIKACSRLIQWPDFRKSSLM